MLERESNGALTLLLLLIIQEVMGKPLVLMAILVVLECLLEAAAEEAVALTE
jgi:hypothetical protein